MNNLVCHDADNQALTNSLLATEKFGKRHSDVLDEIRELFISEKTFKLIINNLTQCCFG